MEVKWPGNQMVFRTCRIYKEELKLLKGNGGKGKAFFHKSGNEILTKDIILDQISECSSYGISRRDTIEVDGQMLEAAVPTDHSQTEAVKEHKNKYSSSESLVEKELGVDKLEISKRLLFFLFRKVSTSVSRLYMLYHVLRPKAVLNRSPQELEFHVQEGNKRRILERLDSDVQKWTNLQITVEDLKRKVEITENSKKGKGIEFENVKWQLEEADEAITKLFDVNQKLMKNVEDAPLFSDGAFGVVSDESGGVRRRRLSEQAKRGSEKIGRLQLEVQKLQFLLLKLDGEKKSRGSTRITERKTRVLLRDYIYGGNRTNQKRKKAPFCACIQPPTKGD
ncbi:unnamed protein product [Prunus armeniaca]